MKVFAHRGWSAGQGENTITAFRKSADRGIDGIEFDVRYGTDGKTIVVTHNPPTREYLLTLEEALVYLSSTHLELLIELKIAGRGFFEEVVESLRRHNLLSRTVLFAFPHIAKSFPWSANREVRLGIIAPLPQHINQYVRTYVPDMILLGWGDRVQRFVFKLVWSILSLPKVMSHSSAVRFVVGVAYGKADTRWLSKQEGLYGYTIDDPSVG